MFKRLDCERVCLRLSASLHRCQIESFILSIFMHCKTLRSLRLLQTLGGLNTI